MEVIVKFSGSLAGIARELAAQVELLGDNYAILTLPAGDVSRLYSYSEIEYVELPKNLVFSLKENIFDICGTSVRQAAGGLTGAGVAVGVIDSGVDFTHPDFIGPDGNSRVLWFWDQTGSNGRPPQGFYGGTEYSNAALNAMLKAPRAGGAFAGDTLGHGTAVAGIAAGNGKASGGAEAGVAPGASLIVVKLGERGRQSFARTTEIMRALKYIVDRAQEQDMPAAINLSYGTNDGSHAGNTLFEAYIDTVSARWKNVIVVAAGNEGTAGHHYYGKVANGEELEAGFTVGPGVASLNIVLWKSFADIFMVELAAPNGMSSGWIGRRDPARQFTLNGAQASVYYGQPSFYNGGQEIYIRLSREGGVPEGLWGLRVAGRQVTEGGFHIWLPTVEEVGAATAFTAPNADTTITLPATAKNVISVGGYNSAFGAVAAFSGRGYTARNRVVKPDLVAPAVNILTTSIGGGYSQFSGTSMAAPFVTGAAAIIMEWGIVKGNDRFLYSQRVKAFLLQNTKKPAKIEYPNPQWGYGALCLEAALDTLAEYDWV
jgi:subtilisin family serine protease